MSVSSDETIIIGTGLGGLLAGAYLASKGRPVTFLEALDLVGGRFTHIDYEGFAVPTGAFHALPGGTGGPIYTCLRALGISVEVKEIVPAMQVSVAGKRHPFHMPPFRGRNAHLRSALGVRNGALLGRVALMGVADAIGAPVPITRYTRGVSRDEQLTRFVDHLTCFSFGVHADSASAAYIVRSFSRQRFQGEGLLVEGNRALVTALLDFALARGATLRTKAPVARILVEQVRASGVELEGGERLPASRVLSNAGAEGTCRLLGPHAPAVWRERLSRTVAAHGAAHAIRSRRQFLDHASIDIPIELDHISGIVPVSNITPKLSPPGWHYALAYQVLDEDGQIDRQLEPAREELVRYLGDDVEVFNTAVYHGQYPAATVAPSVKQYGRNRFPAEVPGIRELYLVGQDVAGYGFAAETIGDSSRALWRRLG